MRTTTTPIAVTLAGDDLALARRVAERALIDAASCITVEGVGVPSLVYDWEALKGAARLHGALVDASGCDGPQVLPLGWTEVEALERAARSEIELAEGQIDDHEGNTGGSRQGPLAAWRQRLADAHAARALVRRIAMEDTSGGDNR